jgi:hypothetical protein
MKKFIIERDLPGVGKLTPADLNAIILRSSNVVDNLGVPYHWIQTFVTDHKLYCIHLADDDQAILGHASQSGFPANNVAEVRTIIDPSTVI